MLNIEDKIKGLKKEATKEYKALRNETLAVCVQAANDLEESMREKGFVPWGSVNTSEVTVSYSLQGKQSLKDMRPYLKQIAKTRLFCPATYQTHAEYGFVSWTFETKAGDPTKKLRITVHLGQSISCKRVATGRMTEEYEVVCDEIPAGLLEV